MLQIIVMLNLTTMVQVKVVDLSIVSAHLPEPLLTSFVEKPKKEDAPQAARQEAYAAKTVMQMVANIIFQPTIMIAKMMMPISTQDLLTYKFLEEERVANALTVIYPQSPAIRRTLSASDITALVQEVTLNLKSKLETRKLYAQIKVKSQFQDTKDPLIAQIHYPSANSKAKSTAQETASEEEAALATNVFATKVSRGLTAV